MIGFFWFCAGIALLAASCCGILLTLDKMILRREESRDEHDVQMPAIGFAMPDNDYEEEEDEDDED